MEETIIAQLAALVLESGTSPDGTPTPLVRNLAIIAARTCRERGDLRAAEQWLDTAAADADSTPTNAAVAGELLMLARAWGKVANQPDRDERVRRALERAASIAPAEGTPAHAQWLQRHGLRDEAIAAWREAVRVAPHEAGHALNLGRLYEQAGQPAAARDVYVHLARSIPALTLTTTLVVAQRLDALAPELGDVPDQRRIKVALVGNATLDHLRSYTTVALHAAGLVPTLFQGGFDQYHQELLDPASDLYRFSPDVVVCAIHASRLFPRLHDYPFDMSLAERNDEIAAGLQTVRQLLDALTARCSAMVLLHTMVAPRQPALGILDLADELGQTALFHEVNRRLADLVRERYRGVYLVDEDRLQSRVGKDRATDVRLWLTARMPWGEAVLPLLAGEYARFVSAQRGLSRKCIVLDLDNTLWGGVIGEDGLGGIELGADAPGNAYVAFQHELDRLWRRGVLLAVASKNNPADALAVFEQHPSMVLRRAHFAAERINWDEKVESIRSIAKELNIGLDSLVFLDDNPVERAKVRAALPDVLTPDFPDDPAAYRQLLLDLPVFDTLAMTAEDRSRARLYAEQKARTQFESEHEQSGSLETYLADLAMVVEIDTVNEQTLARVAQLTNKTNQFNLTTRRYSEAMIAEIQRGGAQVFTMRVRDRFGDTGLVGVAITRDRDGAREIDTLLLSCRVMGRGVETAMLSVIADGARRAGLTRLEGWYLPTAKNDPVKECYARHGFTLAERTADGGERWTFAVTGGTIAVPAWLDVRLPAAIA